MHALLNRWQPLAATSTSARKPGAVGTIHSLTTTVSVHGGCFPYQRHLGTTLVITCSAQADDTAAGSSWYDGGADEDRPRRRTSSFGGRGGRGRGGTNRPDRQQRPGDWTCSECGELNFARRTSCRKCDAPAPDNRASNSYRDGPRDGPREFLDGDWNCPECGQHNFARRTSCFKCDTPAPEGVRAERPRQDRGKDDWDCPNCGEHNFGRRQSCRSCDTPRPGGTGVAREGRQQVREGDWVCAECGDVNFGWRHECRKCQAARPEDN